MEESINIHIFTFCSELGNEFIDQCTVSTIHQQDALPGVHHSDKDLPIAIIKGNSYRHCQEINLAIKLILLSRHFFTGQSTSCITPLIFVSLHPEDISHI